MTAGRRAFGAEAGTAGAQEDAVHGKERKGDELPQELRRREDRLGRIQAAKAALEADAKAVRETTLAEREREKNPPEDRQGGEVFLLSYRPAVHSGSARSTATRSLATRGGS